MDIEKQIEKLINHDIYLELSHDTYGYNLEEYECMIFSFISISSTCLQENNLTPSILIFGYNKNILCNRDFKISVDAMIQSTETNMCLELIKDEAKERIYFMLQSKLNPQNVLFQSLWYDKPIEEWNHQDYSKILLSILENNEFREKTEEVNCEVFYHRINFTTGKWSINQLQF